MIAFDRKYPAQQSPKDDLSESRSLVAIAAYKARQPANVTDQPRSAPRQHPFGFPANQSSDWPPPPSCMPSLSGGYAPVFQKQWPSHNWQWRWRYWRWRRRRTIIEYRGGRPHHFSPVQTLWLAPHQAPQTHRGAALTRPKSKFRFAGQSDTDDPATRDGTAPPDHPFHAGYGHQKNLLSGPDARQMPHRPHDRETMANPGNNPPLFPDDHRTVAANVRCRDACGRPILIHITNPGLRQRQRLANSRCESG